MTAYDDLREQGRALEGKESLSTPEPTFDRHMAWCPICKAEREYNGRYCSVCHRNDEGRTYEQDMRPRPEYEIEGYVMPKTRLRLNLAPWER